MKDNNSIIGIGLALIILFVIFGSVMYLGIFNLSPPAGQFAMGGESVASDGYSYKSSNYRTTYHVFNYFNSGALSVMLILGIIITLAMVDRLYKATGSLLAFLLYLLGTLLIFSSATIFLFGVHDILTFKGLGETTIEPTMMQQYGWIIETVVFGILGYLFIWAGEFIQKREEEEGAIIHLTIAPIASLLALFTIPVFIFGIHGTINPGYEGASYEWVIETIVFGALAAFAFNKIDKMRFKNGEKESWKPYPLFGLGYAVLIPAAFMFIFTVIDVLNNSSAGSTSQKLFLEVLVFTVVGYLSFLGIDRIRKKENKPSAFPLALGPGGFLFMLTATLVFIFGFSSWLRADITANTYRSSFAWIVEAILFGIVGLACISFSDKIRNELEKTRKDMPSLLVMCGLIVWIASVIFYFGTVNSYVSDKVPDGKLFAEFLVYGVVGLGLIIYGDKLRKEEGFQKERFLPNTLSYSGGILLLLTLLMFIGGLHEFLYSREPNTEWLMKDIAYGVAGVVYLLVGNSMVPILPEKKKKDKKLRLQKKEKEQPEKEE